MTATHFDLNIALNILWNRHWIFNVERKQNDFKNNSQLYISNYITGFTL